MKAFVFSVKSLNAEDFEIIIELLSNQTFEDFFIALKNAIGFTDNELASFYLCNSAWKPKKEIALIDMGQDDDENNKVLIMSKTKLNIIEDPHQKILFVYDYIKNHKFNIELIKIKDRDPDIEYPNIVKIKGKYIKTLTPNIPIPVTTDDDILDEEDDEEEILEEFDVVVDNISEDENDTDDIIDEHFFEDIADKTLDDFENE